MHGVMWSAMLAAGLVGEIWDLIWMGDKAFDGEDALMDRDEPPP